MNKHTQQTGFTLIELMIVVAIIGMLLAIAVPQYRESVLKGARGEGRAYVLQLASAEERYATMQNTYTTTVTTAAIGLSQYSGGSVTSPGNWVGSVAAGGAGIASSFTATATAQNSDAKCATLTVNQAGVRGFSGTGDMKTCWGQ